MGQRPLEAETHRTAGAGPEVFLKASGAPGSAPLPLPSAASPLSSDWIAGYHLGCHLLAESQRLVQLTGLDLVSLHILGEVAIGTSQRAVHNLLAGRPATALVPMSSRTVALMTGLPRETVRRRIGRLVKAGYLSKTQAGLLPTPRLEGSMTQAAVRESVARHARLTNRLIETGLLALAES